MSAAAGQARSGPASVAGSLTPASPRWSLPSAATPEPRACAGTGFATHTPSVGGADPAQVQALLGHASIDTAARYFRSGTAENAAVIERIFDH
jgi:hypothetical protein